MNKKPFIITAVSLIGIIALIGGTFYLQTFKTAHFDLKKDHFEVTIYQGEKMVTSFDSDSDIRLQKGDYSYTTDGSDYTNTPTGFTVGNTDPVIVVDPPYSPEFRDKVLTAELPEITKVLVEEYPILSSDFTIARGDVYDDGTWYGTTFTQKPNTVSEQGDMYRAVLKKEKGTWVIKTKPALVLSAKEYPDIPHEILSKINKVIN